MFNFFDFESPELTTEEIEELEQIGKWWIVAIRVRITDERTQKAF